MQEHILSHLDEFLHQHVEIVPATTEAPCGLVLKPGVGRLRRGLAVRPGEFYVHPVDGLVKRARRRVSARP